jgi:hypothetical protein
VTKLEERTQEILECYLNGEFEVTEYVASLFKDLQDELEKLGKNEVEK